MTGHQQGNFRIRGFKPSSCPIRRRGGNSPTVCDGLLGSEDRSQEALSIPNGKSKR